MKRDSKSETEFIWGRKPIIEAIRGGRKIFKIYLEKTAFPAMRKELDTARSLVEIVSKERISNLVHRGDHQGAVAEAEKFRYSDFHAISEIEKGIIIVADSITDPRNLGAIIRSAVLLGAKGMMIPEKNSSLITPVVCHTSSGATEKLPIVLVDSLAHYLKILKGKDFFVVGTDSPGLETISLELFKPPEKIALIAGSEGNGISRKIRELCDGIVSIPQKSDFDSFNVSVAISIILWEIAKKRKA